MKLIANLSLILTISCDFFNFSLYKVQGFNFKTELFNFYPRIAVVKNPWESAKVRRKFFSYNLFTKSRKPRKRCCQINAGVFAPSAFDRIPGFSSDFLTLRIFQLTSSVDYFHTKG